MSERPPGPPAGPMPPNPPGPGPAPAGAPAGVPNWDALARVWAGEPALTPDAGAPNAGTPNAGAPNAGTPNAGAPNAGTPDAGAPHGEVPRAADAAHDAAARRWLAEHPREAARLAAIDRIVARSLGADSFADPFAEGAPPVDVEAALARVTRRRRDEAAAPAPAAPREALAPGTVAPARRPAPVPRAPAWAARPPRRRRLVAAAVALAVVGIGVARRRATPAGGDVGAVAVTAPAQRHRTAVGQRDSVRLPDGTRVLLAPSTTVEVLAGYGGAARTVALTGEAYFDVAHDDARPFSVVAGPAVVRDIGTRFTVRHDAADRIAVAVTEGAVRLAAVDSAAPPAATPAAAAQPGRPRPAPTPPTAATSRGDSGLVLRAGERGLVARDPRRGFTVARLPGPATRAADDTAWTSGRLVFRDAPLAEVSAALRRWYGVELRAADPTIASRHLTATFRGEPLPDVLRVVGLALGARLDRHGDTVLVRPAR